MNVSAVGLLREADIVGAAFDNPGQFWEGSIFNINFYLLKCLKI